MLIACKKRFAARRNALVNHGVGALKSRESEATFNCFISQKIRMLIQMYAPVFRPAFKAFGWS
jgi:hypothetical protein